MSKQEPHFRLHRNLVLGVIANLDAIFNEKLQADKVIAKTLKSNKRWGKRDRAFIAENTYEAIRWKRLYSGIAEVKAPFTEIDLWRMLTVRWVLMGISFPEWKEFDRVPARRIKGRFDELKKERVFAASIPNWLDDLGVKNFGVEKWEKELAALNTPAQVVVRANRLKTNPKLLQNAFRDEGIQTHWTRQYPDALVLEERSNVFETEVFQKGWFEVQDASSQRVAHFCQVEPGMQVIDACAGAGGKTLHLAAIMESKGQITSMDIYAHKLHELKRRAKRAGAQNITTKLITSTKTIKKLKGRADRVLIDAPCTGLGVLRRNPDAKWKIQPDFLEKITHTQQNILKSYANMVKENGKLIYVTCSILRQENQDQVEAFLKTEIGQGFELDKEEIISPAKSGFDGFYMARLSRIKTC